MIIRIFLAVSLFYFKNSFLSLNVQIPRAPIIIQLYLIINLLPNSFLINFTSSSIPTIMRFRFIILWFESLFPQMGYLVDVISANNILIGF